MPSTAITIRRAQPRDSGHLVRFNLAMALETEGLRLDEAKIHLGVDGLFARPQYGFYVVAEVDGAVVGSLMITYEWSDWRNKVFWWVQSVYVQPGFRGKGVYRQLYAGVKRMALEEDCCGFRLYVEKNNAVARDVYRKLGMRESHYDMFEDHQM